jgi:hypothetical protein
MRRCNLFWNTDGYYGGGRSNESAELAKTISTAVAWHSVATPLCSDWMDDRSGSIIERRVHRNDGGCSEFSLGLQVMQVENKRRG